MKSMQTPDEYTINELLNICSVDNNWAAETIRERLPKHVLDMKGGSCSPSEPGLNLAHLRHTNLHRAKKWHGDSPSSIEFCACELAGEVGEACNAAKKIARLRMGIAGGSDQTKNLAEELADVVICADLLAIKADINLSQAVVDKFNATSAKHGFSDRLALAQRAPEKPAETGGAV